MAEIIRKKEATFLGPWLLDTAALAALDEIVDEQWARLGAYRKRQIDKAVRRERNRISKSGSASEHSDDEGKLKDKEIRKRVMSDYPYPGDGRSITLTLSSGNKVRVDSFREALNDVTCRDHHVVKIEVRLCCGDIRGDLVVPTPDKHRSLSLVTLPEASQQADELFVRLNGWCEQNKPDWFRWLCGLGPGAIMMSAILFCIFCFMIVMLTGSVSDTWKDEARKLSAADIKPQDYGRVLKLLLEESAGFRAERTMIHPPRWIVPAGITWVVVAFLLSIYPASTAFEIGKGIVSVRYQKRYDWFLRKIIPTFLIMGVAASFLGSFAFDLLWKRN